MVCFIFGPLSCWVIFTVHGVGSTAFAEGSLGWWWSICLALEHDALREYTSCFHVHGIAARLVRESDCLCVLLRPSNNNMLDWSTKSWFNARLMTRSTIRRGHMTRLALLTGMELDHNFGWSFRLTQDRRTPDGHLYGYHGYSKAWENAINNSNVP